MRQKSIRLKSNRLQPAYRIHITEIKGFEKGGSMMKHLTRLLAALALALMLGAPASAADFSFSTGGPDGLIATASRPESHRKIEIESADDFILTSRTVLQRATFTGLLFHGGPGEIREVRVEIYRVFPKDSDTARIIRVPTRTN